LTEERKTSCLLKELCYYNNNNNNYVHFVMDVLFVFSKMWRFPYPFGFSNTVWIYGSKICNDDDDDDDHNRIVCGGG